MKKALLFFTLLAFTALKAQIVTIPDANFKQALITGYILSEPETGNGVSFFVAYDSNGYMMTTVDTNGDGEIQESEAAQVYELRLDDMNVINYIGMISDLTGIEAFVNLTYLRCSNNQLTTLDVSANTNLISLYCNDNQITTLNLSGASSLTYLGCSNNQLTTLDVSANTSLISLYCNDNQLSTLNVSGASSLINLYCGNNQLSTLDVSANTSLEKLYCDDNQLSTLNVSGASSLINLYCGNNQLSTLDVSANTSLTYLYCYDNQLTTLNVSGTSSLTDLRCSNNQLTTLDVSTNTSLRYLYCSGNQLGTLDVSANASLVTLNCAFNDLTTLDVSANMSLISLECGSNDLTTLDVSTNTSLTSLMCDNIPNLEYVNLKNGNNDNFLTNSSSGFSNLPNLQSVCVDELNTDLTNFISTETGHAVTYTAYCSFSPAQSNIIMGTAFFDLDNNGCDAQDVVFDNFLITASNGIDSFATYAQADGSYSVFTNEGDFTTSFTASLPSYFSVSPASYTNTFTGFDNTFTADFCITANQTVNDVNVTIVPLVTAIPGFDASYQIVYKNIGTTQLSGAISFAFDDTKLDFLTATATVSSQTANSLSFDYANLDPFETRTITLDFNVHTPTASQPTNIGDVLDFTAVINPVSGDYTPADNTFSFHQTVRGSYDPNDMTCTAGDEILLADASNYLHYVIRFQNTGTADAINVVVKNVLDDKLDWSTLQLESTSHTSRVAIKNGNDVAFIFEGIHLPDSTTDEPGSHGYIAYKIKPKDNVVLGDVFNNTADIFFDYNAAIVTNTASTTIVNALSVNDAQLLQFSVYPIPSKGLLNISSRTVVKNVAIYSKLGQLVLEATDTQQVTIASLAKGIYFVKVTDKNGNFGVRKIIKE